MTLFVRAVLVAPSAIEKSWGKGDDYGEKVLNLKGWHDFKQ